MHRKLFGVLGDSGADMARVTSPCVSATVHTPRYGDCKQEKYCRVSH